MAKIERSIVIEAPVEKVFAFLTDLDNFVKINPPETEMEILSRDEGPQRVGFTAKVRAKVGDMHACKRDKSNTVIKFKGKTILTLNDLTAWGLMKEIENHTVKGKCEFGHLIIPDLTRLTARSRAVRKELLTTLQILMAEGMKGIHTYNIDVHFKNPLKLGVIGCITRLDLMDRRNVWSKIGLLSRFIPFSFDYDEQLKINILKFINKDESLK